MNETIEKLENLIKGIKDKKVDAVFVNWSGERVGYHFESSVSVGYTKAFCFDIETHLDEIRTSLRSIKEKIQDDELFRRRKH